MLIHEREFDVPLRPGHKDLLAYFADEVAQRLEPGEIPVRFVVSGTDAQCYRCELGVMTGLPYGPFAPPRSIFSFRKRAVENTGQFNVVLLVPTGIGAEIGGHAGDAGPVAILLAGISDCLITHPNVVNASDINELPQNGLYVEGSVICRLLGGTAGLQRVRSNRVLFVADAHAERLFTDGAINSLNAARAAYGLNCPQIVELDPPVKLKAEYASSGRAAGRVEGMQNLVAALEPYRGRFDAIALASVIEVPANYHMDYFASGGAMVNPWGGVEAIYTHAISMLYDLPSAHSPMMESEEICEIATGIVDPRMAAEAVSWTFLQCIFKGLHRSPRIISDPDAFMAPGVMTAADVSCVVIPDGCLGLPILAALEQGIPVIGVRENRNLLRNDTAALPWAPGQYIVVDNYLEAAGVLCAMKAGITAESIRRPLKPAPVDVFRAAATLETGAKNGDAGVGVASLSKR
jgi:hypothetical protein